MIACVSCSAPLPDGAAFCSSCGRTQSAQAPTARAALFDPAARRAATIATQSAQGFIAEIGVDRALCILGGLLGIVGALLPYVSLALPTGTLPMSLGGGLTLLGLGVPGVLVLLIAIVLGAGSVVLRPSRAFAFAGVGLTTIVLSKLFGDWFTIAFAQALVQAISAMAANTSRFGSGLPEGVHFGAGGGFYCLFIGFAVLFYAYVRLASAER